MKKFDCFTCRWKGEVIGSAHICCKHPSLGEFTKSRLFEIISIVAKSGSIPKINTSQLNIKANPYGVKSGWFNFPFEYDPTWLDNCDGYEQVVK